MSDTSTNRFPSCASGDRPPPRPATLRPCAERRCPLGCGARDKLDKRSPLAAPADDREGRGDRVGVMFASSFRPFLVGAVAMISDMALRPNATTVPPNGSAPNHGISSPTTCQRKESLRSSSSSATGFPFWYDSLSVVRSASACRPSPREGSSGRGLSFHFSSCPSSCVFFRITTHASRSRAITRSRPSKPGPARLRARPHSREGR